MLGDICWVFTERWPGLDIQDSVEARIRTVSCVSFSSSVLRPRRGRERHSLRDPPDAQGGLVYVGLVQT